MSLVNSAQNLLAEKSLLEAARAQVSRNRYRNRLKSALYDGTAKVRNLEIAVPPSLANIGVVSDWPKTVVDIRHERLQFQGWADDGRLGMDDVFTESKAALAVSESTLDAMTCGVAFLSVDQLDRDESPVMSAAHPSNATVLWDPLRGRPVAGYRRTETSWNEGTYWEFLYLPGETVVYEHRWSRSRVIGRLRIPGQMIAMSRMRNRLSPNKWQGRSEITPAVTYYTHAAVRTMLGMEINREYYIMPKRWALNADMELFGLDEDSTAEEKKEARMRAAADQMLMFPPPEPGDPEVKVGEFATAPPTPFMEQLKVYSQKLSGATGIPAAYLGFETANLPSGDSLRAWQERLVRSVENMQELANPDLTNIGMLLYSMFESGGGLASEIDRRAFLGVDPQWRDASSPTKAADADASTKMIGAGVLPGSSRVARERAGLSPSEIRRLEADERRASYRTMVAQAAAGQPAEISSGAPETDYSQVKAQADALGALIRAGVDPEGAADRVGLSGIEFTGVVPVSLRQPESRDSSLEEA